MMTATIRPGSLIAILFATALWSSAQTPLSPARNAHRSRPNILLVTIDTVRADHIGCYGDRNASTPTLDGLAADGTRFSEAFSQVPLTWPSHASILTGTYPFHNRVQDFTGQPLSAEFRTIAEVFQQHGYATGAVVSSFVLDRSWGLARGFDSYDDAFGGKEFVSKDLALVERPAKESVDRALQWLAKPRSKPFFFWLHLYDPHSPYNPPEPFRSRFKDRLYDGEISYADSELGRLIRSLKARGLYSSTAIVVTSDHGESLGEHGEKEHGFFIYDSTTHVPLILKPPSKARRTSERTVTYPVELTAIAPTLLQVAGLTDVISKQFDGTSLLSPKPPDSALAYSETFYPFSSFGWSPLRGLRSARFHYIQAPRAELYDLGNDADEKQNLAASNPPMLGAMQHKLKEFANRAPTNASTAAANSDPSVQEKLRALGYVGYAAPHEGADLEHLADPKDKLSEYEQILAAGDAFRAEDFEAGEEMLHHVAQEEPQLYVVPFMLGEAELRQKQWARAAEHLKQAIALNPGFDQAMTALSRTLFQLGRQDEAMAWIARALEHNPDNYRAWYQRGWIESGATPDSAVTSFEKVLVLQPNFAPAYRDLGVLEIRRHEYEKAAKHLEAATKLGLGEPKVYNFLGIAYSNTNRQLAAISAYEQALRLDPNLAEAHLNLGFAYQQNNKLAAAKSEYEEACRLQPKFCASIPKLP